MTATTDARPSLPVSTRVSAVSLSAIKEMAMRAARIADVASLTWGVPSFRTPAHIRAAVRDALETDPEAGKYTLPDGLPELRETVAASFAAATGVEVSAAENVIVTAGNMQGVKVLLDTILNPGDEVIVTDPCFASHIQQITLCGGVPIFWRLDERRGWAVDTASLEAAITQRTRAILIVTPSNPTGVIFSHDDLTRVAAIARQHNLLLVFDDPYSHFSFDKETDFRHVGHQGSVNAAIAYLFTFSKRHAMSGWRLGYAIVSRELKQQMLKAHDATLICAPRPSQLAGLAALQGDQTHLAEFRTILARRRELICSRLDRVPHVFSYVRPQGAYYVFPRIEAAHKDSESFAIDLLEKAKVCVTPGRAFGPAGESHVRMAFCVADAEIDKAFDRIEAYFPR